MIRRRGLIAGAAITGLASNWAETEQARAEGTLLIDSHVHVWKHDPAFPFAAGAHPPAQDASAEMLLDLMKANGSRGPLSYRLSITAGITPCSG